MAHVEAAQISLSDNDRTKAPVSDARFDELLATAFRSLGMHRTPAFWSRFQAGLNEHPIPEQVVGRLLLFAADRSGQDGLNIGIDGLAGAPNLFAAASAVARDPSMLVRLQPQHQWSPHDLEDGLYVAVRGISRMEVPDHDRLTVLALLLKSPDRTTRFHVVEALGDLASHSACSDVRAKIEVIFSNCAENDSDPAVRHEAAQQILDLHA